jgi:flagellar M-ring protein FliF
VDPQQLLARLKSAAGSLTTGQLVTLGAAFVGVVGLMIGSTYWLNTPNYTVLFSDMDAESASSVVTKLKNEKIAYVLDEGGRTVRVPAARVDELRLQFTGQGMPASGRVGFEIFDRTAFGVTDFLEHVNYRRALEGELARTISSIGDVSTARVHIAMPRESLFATQDQSAKASVILKLKNSRPLSPVTVNAITGLVAASVEGLRPEAVVVVDNFGRSLARPGDPAEDANGGIPLERQQRVEKDMAARVAALLEPILGPGRARVNVTARLEQATQEETEERWDPTTVVRSRQTNNQSAGGSSTSAQPQGVAGAPSNLPSQEKAAAQAGAAAGPSHTSETTNYEVSKLTRHRIQPRGDVARLSVAVVVDATDMKDGKSVRTSKPRSAAEIQKIHDLVAASVGLDTDRGDQLTVENIAFDEPAVEEPAPVSRWQQYQPQVMELGRILAVVVLGLVAIFAVIRPIMRRALGAPMVPAVAVAGVPGTAAVPTNGARTVEDLENEIEAELAAAANLGTQRRLPVLTRRVAAMTQREPENTARLLRTWLSEEER